MAKPSVTNIRPPSKSNTESNTDIWQPPKTNWDLDTADWDTAVGQGWAGTNNDEPGAFDALAGQVNTSEPSQVDVTVEDLDTYGYIFFGVNGGADETVKGKSGVAGIIVTGNGMDTITGGNLGDQIWAGNGKDVVHGGGGNDIIFGENGADQIYGDADEGTAEFVEAEEGETVVTQGGDPVFVWDHDPNGETGTPDGSDNTVRKEGVFVDGPDDNPVFHTVFSFSPSADGTYTIAFYNANQLDGPGDPDPDYFTVDLEGGTKYFYSFLNDDDTVMVRVFAGELDPPPSGPPGQWPVDSIASSQAMPTDYEIGTTGGGGNGVAEFSFGDELIGGNGPDKFFYDAEEGLNNVDMIWDYNQGDGTLDPLEGDQFWVKNSPTDNPAELTTFMADTDGDLTDDTLVVYFSENHAVGFFGITAIDQIDIHFYS